MTAPPLPAPSRPVKPYHAGLGAEAVVDAAVELTAESALTSWTIRDLARRLGVSPSVIYHHLPGRPDIMWAVVERVLSTFPRAGTDLPWQQWFRTTMPDLVTHLSHHPGTVRFLSLNGPATASGIRLVDDGITVLRRGGFADRSPEIFSVLFNSTLLVGAINEDRGNEAPDLTAAALRSIAKAGPLPAGTQELQDYSVRFATDPDLRGRVASYLRFTVDLLIAGLESDPALRPEAGAS
ncbi:TetR/AcrR family transcriptional regulator [Nakamurella alba]|uniref:TetR/AcrR family transcriptional regulator n=1 Tax=Nakamurella alba TaxID=2665158 RepID=UPI0018AABD36|nr:TetR family transcriptional regulator [Nakamurella alba]